MYGYYYFAHAVAVSAGLGEGVHLPAQRLGSIMPYQMM